MTKKREKCECGCGKLTSRIVLRLREQDRGTAEALEWAEMSIGPMRVYVPCAPGHDAELSDQYVIDEG